MKRMTNPAATPVQIVDAHALQSRAIDELEAMLTVGRKNLDAIAAISQLAIDCIYQCADGQAQAWNALCRNAFDVMSKPGWPRGASAAGPGRPPELMGMIEDALGQLRRLSEVIARTNKGTLDLIHDRTDACLREIEDAARRTIRASPPTVGDVASTAQP